jgi:hypothetical protein
VDSVVVVMLPCGLWPAAAGGEFPGRAQRRSRVRSASGPWWQHKCTTTERRQHAPKILAGWGPCSCNFHALAARAKKKFELDELARARSSSARFGPARRSKRARAESVFVAREKSEPARLGSVQLASCLVARPNNNLLHKIIYSI